VTPITIRDREEGDNYDRVVVESHHTESGDMGEGSRRECNTVITGEM
jgi:hypothetical protein